MFGKSRPFEATSVATRTSLRPSRKAHTALSRSSWSEKKGKATRFTVKTIFSSNPNYLLCPQIYTRLSSSPSPSYAMSFPIHVFLLVCPSKPMHRWVTASKFQYLRISEWNIRRIVMALAMFKTCPSERWLAKFAVFIVQTTQTQRKFIFYHIWCDRCNQIRYASYLYLMTHFWLIQNRKIIKRWKSILLAFF